MHWIYNTDLILSFILKSKKRLCHATIKLKFQTMGFGTSPKLVAHPLAPKGVRETPWVVSNVASTNQEATAPSNGFLGAPHLFVLTALHRKKWSSPQPKLRRLAQDLELLAVHALALSRVATWKQKGARLLFLFALNLNSDVQSFWRPCLTRSGVKGKRLKRTPVASKTAFARAAPVGPWEASPQPKKGMPGRSINSTWTWGISEKVKIG